MPASIAARHAERLMHAAEVVICEVYGRTPHRRRGSTAGYAVSSCRRAASIFVMVTPGLGPGNRGTLDFDSAWLERTRLAHPRSRTLSASYDDPAPLVRGTFADPWK